MLPFDAAGRVVRFPCGEIDNAKVAAYEARCDAKGIDPCYSTARPASTASKSGRLEYPTAFRQAVNFGSAVTKHAAKGFRQRTQERIDELLVICHACEHYDGDQERCVQCGCKVNAQRSVWRNKLAMADQACPVGKWGPEPR